MKKILIFPLLLVGALTLSLQTVAASSFYTTGSTGVDISYPNCTTKVPVVNFGIVGVTNGLVYGHNGCMAAEAQNFTDVSLYVNTGLNASKSSQYYIQAQVGCNGDVYCAAYNYGYNAAKDAISYANSQGVSSSKWWLDVETSNTWNKDVQQNQKSLQGEYDALVANGAAVVGVYSTTAQWQSVTGSWQNNWPSWGATTWTTAAQAQSYCTGHQFTGGPSLLMQYASKRSKVDQDVAC
ncbi:MAG TPA: hypothetical protein VHB51_02500 [Candidatus Saccharimonadales bacterium]|nr:hypothetical protein [Candidatus Saccharimonadales bacterium]